MIRLHEPTFGEEEIEAAVEVLRSTNVTQGEKVKEFESKFHRRAVACNSGSSANLLAVSALKALGLLKAGDEIIVPALSWSTTVFPIIQNGCIPVFVDCDLDTLNISIEGVKKAINRKTKAIMPVHVYGNPCDRSAITTLADVDGLSVIEDCCEAQGARYMGYPIGEPCRSNPHISTFSFYFSHSMTTLEGGLAQPNREDISDMMRIQRSHGWSRELSGYNVHGVDPRFTFVELGYNLRMTELQAAIGLVQLTKLEAMIDNRRATHNALREVLDFVPWLQFQQENPNGESSCFGFTIILKDDAPFSVSTIRESLEEYGIETRSIICGNMARQPVMAKYKHRCVGKLPNATKVMRDGFSIGCHQDISNSDINKIADAFNLIQKAAE